ncbi:MAG: cobalamin biosynthesis protein CobD [Oscillospiraceae bacterium]|nr:cobalamin biosynthesis protein CobD [Oscillospiraceae bacterium]
MTERFLIQTAAILAGFVLDWFIGDPYSLPHPIVAIGKLIAFLDRKLRLGGDDKRDILRGALTAVIVITISTGIPALVLELMWRIHPAVFFVVNSIMCFQMLAARQLVIEAEKVRAALETGDVENARTAVSYIVGRDTDVLDDKGICRAAVETVAENGSDGVIAPLFWMFLFGAAGGFFYKSINTMDSMLGYKNEKYLYFGRVPARTDDVVNYIPARLSALLMIAACPFLHLDTKNAWKIFLRDRYKHASPNSAQTESVCAGALDIRLAGDAVYGGIVKKKEYIGDPIREIEPYDIRRAGNQMYLASAFMLMIGLLIRIGAYFLCT